MIHSVESSTHIFINEFFHRKHNFIAYIDFYSKSFIQSSDFIDSRQKLFNSCADRKNGLKFYVCACMSIT